MKWQAIAVLLLATFPAVAEGGTISATCASCAQWTTPQEPFRVYGNTYYVGTRGLSAILVASDQGLILIDGDLPQSAPQIVGHIRALGFNPKNIKLILNSHAHFDHAGGIAQLQRVSGGRIAASPWSANVLRQGVTGQDDPQYDLGPTPIDAVDQVDVLHDGQTVRIGTSALTAHFTAGHTPGGTSWSWISCEGKRCLHIVYADSLTAVSADNYRFTGHPELLRGFYKSFATLEALPCDVLLSAHPGFSGTLEKLKARDNGGQPDAFVDPLSCRKYAAAARVGLEKRIAQEAEK
jgi:metallo-beta-lactamase class B